ncbi:SPOR domain-containing protein [Aliiglaciecola sp. M165]|uniref:SPOR domain-containing protein n=1 Tax=Aliiglaciecola sp. M165 TaxID=2593649 RepID=UPI00117C7C98|nr:hypothetical protein [Aliiglaciecola sp. M165]TRY31387.1 hypothetical protein FM019_10960 [Aliiglaciecola sp. M165]
MAIDALHDRLEYLVSYSSQLILIGCESLAQQQSSLQQFLSVQHENTDIAFLNGEPEHSDDQYRNEIYRQLIKQDDVNDLPLDKGLLQRLPEDTGPILVCICAAEHISSKLLNELWQLVRSNKSQKQGRHINVLLFGSPDWIAQAKQQLVIDTKHLPVLLSTETVEPISSTDSLLDTIRQNRRIVTSRMESAGSEVEDEALIAKPLFKYAIAVLFLALFASIIYWQYPEEIRNFLNPQSTQTKVTPPLHTEPETTLEDSDLTQNKIADSPIDASKADDMSVDIEQTVALVNERVNDEDTSSIAEAATPTENESQTLVTNWQQEVKKIQAQAENITEQPSVTVPDTLASETDPSNESRILAETEEENSLTSEQISANKLDAEQAIMALSDDKFLLQISAMSDRLMIENFIAEHGLSDDVWLYTTQRFGGDWHVVVHNVVFDTLIQARDFVAQLPASIDNSQPFAKSVRQIKQELATANE